MGRLFLVAVTLMVALAAAGPSSAANPFGVPDGYDGLSTDGITLVDASVRKATMGVFYYYRLHGSWPETWVAVVNEGLVTAPLKTYDGNVIDPDDRRIDFNWDIQYEYRREQPARLIQFSNQYPRRMNFLDMPRGKTFEELAALPDRPTSPNFGGQGNLFDQRMRNPHWKRTYVMVCIMQQLAIDYWLVQGKVNGWDDFAASEFFPQGDGAFNPLTGKSWAADGMPNSLVWRDSQGPGQVPQLWILDGETGLKIGAGH